METKYTPDSNWMTISLYKNGPYVRTDIYSTLERLCIGIKKFEERGILKMVFKYLNLLLNITHHDLIVPELNCR